MIIHGLNKTTLLDYPEHIACTVFTGGCNLRCQYCQNAPLILNPTGEPQISEEDFFSFLNNRKKILQGVCITGGEPTLNTDLETFIRKIRSYDLYVKLDTNGMLPHVLEGLLSQKLLDYVAMDIKGPLEDYEKITQTPCLDTKSIIRSVSLIQNSNIPYEFRTTVTSNLFTNDSFENIGKWLQGSRAYYLQPYRHSEMVLCSGLSAPSREELTTYLNIVKKYIPNSKLRGTD